MNLPMLGATGAPLMLENIPLLQAEVRALARERGAVVLAHNYQLPEIQDVADYVGDSLGLSQQAAKADGETIVFCGVHFMAETASILCPDKRVLIPDPDAGCSLADSITAEQLREWKAGHPHAVVVMYVNTTAEVKAETDYCCTSSNAVKVVEHIYRERGEGTEILFGPDMFLGAYVEKTLGRSMHVWDEGVHMLSTGGMLGYAREHQSGTAIVATETGMLHPLRQAAPDTEFVAANEAAHCKYMKMITLPKLRDALRDRVHEVKVAPGIAARARVPIKRMVAIS
jgi:quinolinate synthase